MAIRHKRIVATLDRGEAADWNNDHIADFSDYVDLYENFFGLFLVGVFIHSEW